MPLADFEGDVLNGTCMQMETSFKLQTSKAPKHKSFHSTQFTSATKPPTFADMISDKIFQE